MQTNNFRNRAGQFLLCWILAVCAGAAHANGYLLHQGAVVDERRTAIYLMEPEGLAAREIASGNIVWRNPDAAQPLGLHGDLLMALSEADRPNRLEVLFLNADSGAVETRVETDLPGDVRAWIDDGPAQRFTALTAVVDGEVFLYWSFVSRPLRGAPAVSGLNRSPKMPRVSAPAGEGTPQRQPDEPRIETDYGQRLEGVVRLDPEQGIAVPLAKDDDAPPAPVFVPDLAPGERLSGRSGRQFRSADDRHVLASRRIADNRVWNRHEWSIVERSNSRPLGVIARSSSYAPFFVHDGLLIYVSQPFARRADDGAIEARELKLDVVNLETTRPIWTAILRDTAFRGPMPP